MSAVSLSDLSSEFESDEKQLLVHQSSGTTVINLDHGMATFSAGGCGSSNSGAGGGAGTHIHHHYSAAPASARGSVTSSMDSCSSVSGQTGNMNISPSATTTLPLTDEELRRIRFGNLVRRAEDIDKSSFVTSTNNCMYIAGTDRQGRPVLVFIGKWFRSKNFDTDSAVMYLIKLLHHVVTSGQDYVVIYFHAKTSKDNVPSYAWIKDVYTTLGYEYKKRLKAFYIVHPTVWTKMTCWWLSTFMAPAIKKKIRNVQALKELSSIGLGQGQGIMDNDANLSIPMFIAEHDMSLNGLRYYQP